MAERASSQGYLLISRPIPGSIPSDIKSFSVLKSDRGSGSGCGSVGREVASNTRCLWFEYSHQQNFMINNLNMGHYFRRFHITIELQIAKSISVVVRV